MNARGRLFGTDLRVVERAPGFDLAADPRGDLERAEGANNAGQALSLRLYVREGELAPLGWPEYGSRLHELVGEPNTKRTHLRAMALARAALERDARVAEVAGITARVLEGERDTVRLDVEVRLIDRPTPLNLVFDLELQATP